MAAIPGSRKPQAGLADPEPYAHKDQPGGDPWGRAPRPRPPALGGPIFNNMPAVILVLAGVILAAQTLDWLSIRGLDGGWFHQTLWGLGALWGGESPLLRDLVGANPWTPYLLHVFVHVNWLHALMNLAALIAFGPAAARPFGRSAKGVLGFLLFFFACGLGGAFAGQLAYASEPYVTMVGASTAISGLLPAAGWAWGGSALMARIAFPWLVINTGLAILDLFGPMPIGWAGHIGGLLVGAAFYPLFVKAFAPARRR